MARSSGRSPARSRRSTVAGSARSRASSTATRTPCFGGDRVNEFSLRAGGASYEELHAAGGGILSTVRATRAAGEAELREARRAASRLDARPRHDDVRGEVGLRPRPRHGAGAAAGGSCRRRSADVARRPHRAARVRDGGRLRRLPARGGAAGGSPDRGGRRRLPRAGLVRRDAGAPLSRGVPRRGLALRLHGDQFTESGAIAARDRARRALGRSPRSDRAGRRRCARRERRHGRAPAGERALPRATDATGPGARRRRRR